MIEDLLSYLLTAAGSGVFTGLLTAKFTRKEAEASALEHVQTIYQRLTADLSADRDRIKREKEELQTEMTGVKAELQTMRQELSDMTRRVDENERWRNSFGPYLCKLALTCSQRLSFDNNDRI